MKAPAIVPSAARPRLELSGPRLASAFRSLVSCAEDSGGIERYVDALKLKSRLFAEALDAGRARTVELAPLRDLLACMSTARRRIGPYAAPDTFGPLRDAIADLLEGPAADTDARIDAFCARFPDDRAHRWVRDVAAEVLHSVDPEKYPPMQRWVWDERANTGVLREIWHGEEVDGMTLEVPSRFETFLVLREELAGFLASQGVFRDVLFYVDLLLAQVYAAYIHEQGGSYLRADFAHAEEPMMHLRRLLGLDALGEGRRSRLKATDGAADLVEPPRLAG